MKMKRKLPLGIQTVQKIREQGCYYVDKTAYARRLVEEGDHYFLSRPRRFGKSLFLDTLKELFEGNEPLFRGLAVHDGWDWSVRRPVVRLDFGSGNFGDPAHLPRAVLAQLDAAAEDAGVAARYDVASLRFEDLLKTLHRRAGQRVVVLVDEYDRPILDALKTPAAICGYTEADLDTVFAPELPGLDRDRIRGWYNGYNWLGPDRLYNPFDILQLFRSRRFRPYWFETGTPAFLIDTLIRQKVSIPSLDGLRSDDDLLSKFDVRDAAPEALLFQTGYLTIREEETGVLGAPLYRLGYPNHEVRWSLNKSLLAALTPPDCARRHPDPRLAERLRARDFEGVEVLVRGAVRRRPRGGFGFSTVRLAQRETERA